MSDRDWGFDTRQVHAGQRPDPYTGARAMPIFQTASYVFEDAESAAAYFNLQEYGNTYSRIMNPTTAAFEERVAALEGGVGARCVRERAGRASRRAVHAARAWRPRRRAAALYGGTITQLKHLQRKLGFEVTFVDGDSLDAWRAALRPETKALYGETIGNPAATSSTSRRWRRSRTSTARR